MNPTGAFFNEVQVCGRALGRAEIHASAKNMILLTICG